MKSQPDYNLSKDTNIVSQRTGMTPYEVFCANNKDINCATIDNLKTNSHHKDYGKVILSEHIEKKEIISNMMTTSSDINIHPEDMNKLLDHLYEEKLPDDIIDVEDKEKDWKNKVKEASNYFNVPVCFHLDHATDFDFIKKSISSFISFSLFGSHCSPTDFTGDKGLISCKLI